MLGIYGTEHMREAPTVKVLANLLVLYRHSCDKVGIRQYPVCLGIGRLSQFLVAVAHIVAHREKPLEVKPEGVRDRLDYRRLWTRRLASPANDAVGECHRIEVVIPNRNGLYERRAGRVED